MGFVVDAPDPPRSLWNSIAVSPGLRTHKDSLEAGSQKNESSASVSMCKLGESCFRLVTFAFDGYVISFHKLNNHDL